MRFRVRVFVFGITFTSAMFLLFACGGSTSNSGIEQPAPSPPPPDPFEARVSALNEELSSLDSSLPTSPTDDLMPLSRVAMARVVGMGEASHGTRDFFHLKHKIFRWLVEEHGFRVFAMESDIAEAYYLNRYVQTGEGDLEAIMLQRMNYWPWYTEEVRDLIQWMADYNADHPDAEPLRYIGVDCQSVGQQPDLIIEKVGHAAPELGDQTENAVWPLNVSMADSWTLYSDMTEDDYESIRFQLTELNSTLIDHKQQLVAGSSLQDYRMLLYLLNSLIDSHQTMYYVYNEPSWAVRSAFRERCLADNVQLIEWLAGEGVQVGVWAHNGHVAADEYSIPGHPTMGSNLRQDLGNDYRVIGFSFSHGDFMAQRAGVGLMEQSISLPPLSGSVNELFHAADAEEFILDLGAIPGSELLDWLRGNQSHLEVGAVFDPNLDTSDYYLNVSPLTQLFDAIIHIDRSSAAVPLPYPD